jgi:ankyrin repeat protein
MVLLMLAPPAQDGRTSLIQASIGGYLDLVRLLLDRGASVNAADKVAERVHDPS